MKKLIPALCMLLVAATLLGTSTYAWFSMNATVDATGMQIVAKTDNAYLLISKTNADATAIQTENLITVPLEVAEAEAKVYPSAPALNTTEIGYLTTSGKTVAGATITTAGVKVENAATAAAVTNWYTATAAAPGASALKEGSARQLITFDDYVIERTLYLTVAKGSNAIKDLQVTPEFTVKDSGADIAAAKVVITTSDGGFAILSAANNGNPVDIKGSNNGVTDSTVITVNVYVYYDGNESVVNTNNAANLKGVDINFTFGGTAVAVAD